MSEEGLNMYCFYCLEGTSKRVPHQNLHFPVKDKNTGNLLERAQEEGK